MRELRKRVRWEYGRGWYKRRYGYYEKPSELRRKRKKTKRLRRGGPAHFQPNSLKLPVGQEALFKRTGLFAAGK